EREDRKKIDEPERAERLDIGEEIFPHDAIPVRLMRDPRRADRELDRDPQCIEINEMQNAAVEESTPVAPDDTRKEQARDQEEIRHAERAREFDEVIEPAVLARGLFDAER